MWCDVARFKQKFFTQLACGAILIFAPVCVPQTGAVITITNEGTTNPTLLYQGRPMFKFGPLPEAAVFAVKWGSREFRHRAWLDWMVANGLGYGRVYPESGYPWLPPEADGRVFPFKVVRWEEGRPIVDLTRFNPQYWENMARVIEACAQRGIVLQMQLYQRVFFAEKKGSEGWATNYFNPINNVNQFAVPKNDSGAGFWHVTADLLKRLVGEERPRDGYGLWKAMAGDTVWRKIHRQWVRHILGAIGNNGNVIIDLMNEGAFNKGMTKDWIEFTRDLIERWEQDSGNELLVGMDFDHFYKAFNKTGNAKPLEYVLSHPRLDVIIAEGAESHVVPTLVAGDQRDSLHKDLAIAFRRQYRKPVVSTNSPSRGPQDDLEALHLYQWYSLMTKVQGAGVYAKNYPSLNLSNPPAQIYAQRSRILKQYFDTLKDYAALRPLLRRAVVGPGEHRLALVSPNEVAVYLHSGTVTEAVRAGARLILKHLELPAGDVSIVALDPHTGNSSRWRDSVQDGALKMELPAFDKDLALHIVPVVQISSSGT